MVKPSPWENDMLDTMWAFMQMGGLKADYPALKEACLEASSWAEEDVKMPGFHVSAGIGGIYAGITNSKGEWKDRDRVTTEAVEAVRDYFLAIRETDGVDSMEYKWVTGDGSEITLTLRKTAPENGGSNAE